MGLDTVELVMEVEDEFGITIPDSAASEIHTVGDLVSLCMDRILASKTARCESLPCFLSMRRLVREVLKDPELRIRPRDKVEESLESSDRQRFWKRLPELLACEPRALRRPPWLRNTLVATVLAFPFVLMSTVPLMFEFFVPEFLVLISFATFGFGIALYLLTLRFRTRTPDGYTTFGDITTRMVGLKIATNPPANVEYDNVFSIVKRIVVEQLGAEDDEVVADARFVEDLGVG